MVKMAELLAIYSQQYTKQTRRLQRPPEAISHGPMLGFVR